MTPDQRRGRPQLHIGRTSGRRSELSVKVNDQLVLLAWPTTRGGWCVVEWSISIRGTECQLHDLDWLADFMGWARPAAQQVAA